MRRGAVVEVGGDAMWLGIDDASQVFAVLDADATVGGCAEQSLADVTSAGGDTADTGFDEHSAAIVGEGDPDLRCALGDDALHDTQARA